MVIAETFSPDILLVLLVLPTLVLQIVVAVQIFSASDAAWSRSGQSKTLWIALWLFGWLCLGIVIDLIWLLAIRPRIRTAERS